MDRKNYAKSERSTIIAYVEAKEHIDHCAENKRRVSTDGTASEMSIGYETNLFKSGLRYNQNDSICNEMKLVACYKMNL
jgi:hypothetical protein